VALVAFREVVKPMSGSALTWLAAGGHTRSTLTKGSFCTSLYKNPGDGLADVAAAFRPRRPLKLKPFRCSCTVPRELPQVVNLNQTTVFVWRYPPPVGR
jgi:hypothetical protein